MHLTVCRYGHIKLQIIDSLIIWICKQSEKQICTWKSSEITFHVHFYIKKKKKTCVFGPTSKYAEHPTKPMFMLQIELKD